MKSILLQSCLFAVLVINANTIASIESINSRTRQALTEQITNHVQAQLNNAFAKNQILPKFDVKQESTNVKYVIAYPPNLPPPIVITQTPVSGSNQTSINYAPVTYVVTSPSSQTIKYQSIPSSEISYIPQQKTISTPTIIKTSNSVSYPVQGTNLVNGLDNKINGQQNILNGNKNTLQGSQNIALGSSNRISGNTNVVTANQAIVKGNQNVVYGGPINVSQLF